jgi:hypothetical protein
MLKRTVAVAALIVGTISAVAVAALIVGTISAVALGRRAATLPFTATSRSAEISSSKGYPAPGSTIESAVITDSHPGGRFAAISDVKITGTIADGVTLTAKGTNYTPAGLQFDTSQGTAIVLADGSTSFKGSGRFTGGTGAFKRANGTYTYTGTAPAATGSEMPVVTLHIKGVLRY